MEDEKIDWNKVNKLAQKTKIFKGYFNPLENNKFLANWSVIMSVRNSQKTTGYILLGMLIYEIYGTRIEYMRLSKEDIKPKQHAHFFDSILDLHYIEKITGGKWNSCFYRAGFWFYQSVDGDGTVVEKSTEPFMHVFAITDAMTLKSNYTSNSKFCILDEFEDPTKYWRGDEFVLLCDCLSTIFRSRLNCYITLLGNTLNLYSPWFNELNIQQDVVNMKQGSSHICNIDKSDLTNVFVSILPAKLTEHKKLINLSFFSFKNSKLEAITGECGGWSVRIYPRLPKGKKQKLTDNIYINFEGFLIRIDFLVVENLGLCCNVVPTNKLELDPDAIELTTEMISKENQVYLMRFCPIGNEVQKMYNRNRVYFANNTVGAMFDNFMERCGFRRI